jgi:hypothetical protein
VTKDTLELRALQNKIVIPISLLFIMIVVITYPSVNFFVYFLGLFLATVLMNIIYALLSAGLQTAASIKVNFNFIMVLFILIISSYLVNIVQISMHGLSGWKQASKVLVWGNTVSTGFLWVSGIVLHSIQLLSFYSAMKNR